MNTARQLQNTINRCANFAVQLCTFFELQHQKNVAIYFFCLIALKYSVAGEMVTKFMATEMFLATGCSYREKQSEFQKIRKFVRSETQKQISTHFQALHARFNNIAHLYQGIVFKDVSPTKILRLHLTNFIRSTFLLRSAFEDLQKISIS